MDMEKRLRVATEIVAGMISGGKMPVMLEERTRDQYLLEAYKMADRIIDMSEKSLDQIQVELELTKEEQPLIEPSRNTYTNHLMIASGCLSTTYPNHANA